MNDCKLVVVTCVSSPGGKSIDGRTRDAGETPGVAHPTQIGLNLAARRGQ